MRELTTVPGLVALGAAVVGLVALALSLVVAARTRRIRRAQTAVLGQGERDLVAHAEQLQVAFTQLRDWVEDSMGRLDARTADIEAKLDSALAFHSVIRYDAYGEMSGRQSSSVALLDRNRTGIVVSSILHRDQARIYVKPVNGGKPELELSPEETQAVEMALAAESV